MLKKSLLALAIGVGLGAATALAQDTGTNQNTDQNREENKGVLEKAKDKVLGRDRGTRAEKLEEGVLKLSREDIQKVKQALVTRGYSFKTTEGKEGHDFEEAITRFQKDTGLKSTGDVDIATLNALGFSAIVAIHPDVRGSELARGKSPIVTERPAGMPQDATVVGTGKDVLGFLLLGQDQIEDLQERLKDEGYYRGSTNGAITQEFIDALASFQQAKGIKPGNGMLDFQTLAWFPGANVKVDVTDKPEIEISEPTKAGPVPSGTDRPGTGTGTDSGS